MSSSDSIPLKITPGSVAYDQTSAESSLDVIISAFPPEQTVRGPADICCVVDVSGSMGTPVGNPGTESANLTILDIVKHAVTTIINTLNDDDRLALVAYSSFATVIFGLIPMNDGGKSRAAALLKTLKPDGMTNIWDGLQKGLNVLKDGAGARVGMGNACVMLLTDGVPNKEPPKPYAEMLEDYRSNCGGKLPGTITTFGFGYQLNSPLLIQLAINGGGHYGFIPDSGMVGTAFVNALGNTLSTSVKDAVLTINAKNGAKFAGNPIGSFPCDGSSSSETIAIQLGDLQIGQSRDIVVKMNLPASFANSRSSPGYLEAKLTFQFAGQGGQCSVTAEGKTLTDDIFSEAGSLELRRQRAEQLAELASQKFRLRAVEIFGEAIKLAGIRNGESTNDLAQGRQLISEFTAEVRGWMSGEGMALRQGSGGAYSDDSLMVDPWTRVETLLQDLEGQGVEAFSRPEWYYKWGVHYIPSLARAHQLQQCSNFKDPGVQNYGGSVFREVRDHADDVFCKLPPPGVVKVDMTQFNNRSNPCFHGDCTVRMSDGSTKLVREVRKGDLLAGSRN
eukprot:gene11877-24887_t